MSELTYRQNGDYLIPNLTLPKERPLGKYGRMRKAFLQANQPILYRSLIATGRLQAHLLEMEEAARSRLETLLPQLAKEAGATETLKAANPLKWIGLMNNAKAQAEESILTELIHG